jgi:hypothetical protein
VQFAELHCGVDRQPAFSQCRYQSGESGLQDGLYIANVTDTNPGRVGDLLPDI